MAAGQEREAVSRLSPGVRESRVVGAKGQVGSTRQTGISNNRTGLFIM